MKKPSSWFREEMSRPLTDLEAMSWKVNFSSDGKAKSYRCTILKQECSYDPSTGRGDCRTCNFALAYIMASPDYIKQIGKD